MSDTFSFEQFGTALRIAGLSSRVDAPKVLLAATDRWYPTARLGMALAKAGCVVEAVCPSGHPLSLTRALRQMHRYNGLSPLTSLSRAIRASNPDLVVPADDLATRHLHELHKSGSRNGSAGREICKTIERSLGCADSYTIVGARHALMQVAKEEGIRVPNSAVIANAGDLHGWIARVGFPTVLKANGTSGGDGIKIVNTVQEAERAFRKLQSPPLLARAIKRAVIDRDLTLVRPSLLRRKPVVNAQSFVAGHEATSTIFCWEGQVLASLHFEVLVKAGSTGHATVVRWTDHPEMSAAALKIARRLKLSGFHGLDFMIEAKTGKAYLIEINPRTTQVGHLAFGNGHDLPAALYSALTGKSGDASASLTENDTIALFPQEWKRDPDSPFLLSAYHDVPWQEPRIVSACTEAVQKQVGHRNRKFGTVHQPSGATIGEPTVTNESEPASLVAGRNEI
jgi:hypothetical protein